MIANADEYGLELHHFENWSDAKKALLDNYAEYTAIILDAYCKNDAGAASGVHCDGEVEFCGIADLAGDEEKPRSDELKSESNAEEREES